MHNQRLVLTLAILNGMFWIVLSGLLTLVFESVAFLFVSGGMFLSFLIMDFFVPDYIDYIKAVGGESRK